MFDEQPLHVLVGALQGTEEAKVEVVDAPTWLWLSVVELLAIHEAAYLEHCRRFALLEAA